MSSVLGLWAAGVYLGSGVICTVIAIQSSRRGQMEITDE